MPTLRSIGVHPDLRKRLVVAASGENENHPKLVPISTPNALLSRHPGALRLATDETLQSSKAIAVPQAESLRNDVAVAMLVQSKTGRHWRRIAEVQKSIVSDHELSLGLEQQSDKGSSLFPSALEILQYHHEAFIPKRIQLRVGCPSLDSAIALPSEFSAYSSSNPLSPTTTSSHLVGLPFGYITQFTGPPASGKSLLACHLAWTCANQGGRSWYIHSGAQPHLSAANNNPEALDRIVVAPAMDGFALLARLAEFEQALQEDIDGPSLLIVDSCSVCLGAVEDESMYATVSSTIKRLAREFDLATVLINGTVADRQSGGRKAALGQFWSGTADIGVWIEAHNNGFIKATVQHHFAKEESTVAHYFSLRETSNIYAHPAT